MNLLFLSDAHFLVTTKITLDLEKNSNLKCNFDICAFVNSSSPHSNHKPYSDLKKKKASLDLEHIAMLQVRREHIANLRSETKIRNSDLEHDLDI